MARRHAPADEEPAPTFESDDSDVDESDEVYDARGAIRPMVGLDGRANLGAVDDLCELFDQIDVNGDQHLEWEEFTSFVIEHGMEKSDDDRGGLHDRYLERKVTCEPVGWRPHGGGGPGPFKLFRWIPELRLLCICAAGCWALFSPFPRAAAARDHVRAVFQCSLAPADRRPLLRQLGLGRICTRASGPRARRGRVGCRHRIPRRRGFAACLRLT
jgi:hypothetical protein